MKADYLYALALSLRVILGSQVAGAKPVSPTLSEEEFEFLTKFALSHPKVAARYHAPSTNKEAWLKELEEVTDDFC